MLGLFEKERPQWVCHMAARAGVRPSIENPYVYIHSNIRGTTHLMELSHKFGVKNFVFASSSSVYGGSKSILFSEKDSVDSPVSPYAASKKACELLAYTYHHLYQLNVTGLRFFTVYGPRGRPDMAPFNFIDRISRGLELQQFGDGSSYRDYTYIDDIVDGVVRAIDRPYKYEIINLGKGNCTSLNDFLRIVQKHVGKKAIVKVLPDQPGDVPYTCADVSKAFELLGYRPTVSFDEGIRRTVDWYTNEFSSISSTASPDSHKVSVNASSGGAQLQYNHYTDTHAIFLISFGKEAAESTLVERCILSLRRRGQWTGYIVLLTDAPPGRYEQVWNENENVIVMHPKEEHFNGAEGKPLEFNHKTISLKVKRFKTFILDYIDMNKRLRNIEFIYYLDIDIIAGGNMNHLFSGVESIQHIGNRHQVRGSGLSTLHFFTPINTEYPFQGGTFVVKRPSSRHCLELWRKEIDNIVGGSLGMDQAALRTVQEHIEAGKETKCKLIRMDNDDFLSFPIPRNFDRIAQSSSYTTLIHMSNSKFAKWIDEEKQNRFLSEVLQLSEEEILSGKYGKSVVSLSL
jgi:nucleoside-diphosphate-sugar epimerase